LSDSEDQTPLELALWTGQISVASRLLDAGASIEVQTTKGLTLLHKAVRRGDNASALFLLEHGADINNKYVIYLAPIQRISLLLVPSSPFCHATVSDATARDATVLDAAVCNVNVVLTGG